MKNVIVGTAGHIDHGKTCLIKALTDIDTDRLKEEKQRGITIELGFAELPNNLGMDIGVIDVPGHEKFVRHMLAGIGGIDIVLLIVAADEGFMPQTIEHFEILKMLKIKRGITVITKTDLVDEEWIEVVRDDIKENLKNTFMEFSPVVEVSSHTGEGIDALKEAILAMAKACEPKREDRELLRLPIDRVFSVSGFGTVITGTLMEGSVVTGEEIMLYPEKKTAKVRNIQIHGKTVNTATAGQRTAINVTGIKKEDVRRGDVIAYPGSMDNTYIVDVKIDMFDVAKRLLRNGSRVHFHYGSAETICKVVIMDKECIGAGESCYAQLRFEEEIAVKRGDRFILRFYSPMDTIGGGYVLNPAPQKKKRFDDKVISGFKMLDDGGEAGALKQMLIEESPKLTSLDGVIKKFNRRVKDVEDIIEKMQDEGVVKRIGDMVVHKEHINRMESHIATVLMKYHEKNPLSVGMAKEEFRHNLSSVIKTSDNRKISQVMDYLIKTDVIEDKGEEISLKGFCVELTEKQREMEQKIMKIYEKAFFEPPLSEEVVSDFDDSAEALHVIEYMAASGSLIKLNYRYYIHRNAVKNALDVLMELLKSKGSISLAQYRDTIETSRKYAVMILEYADEIKLTRMDGDVRVLYK